MDYEAADKKALKDALLALRVCPKDRSDLRPVAYLDAVWGCEQCRETWYIPKEGD